MHTFQPHLLVVDDEASIRGTVARILQGIGCSVTTSASGEEALRRLDVQEHRFDLVLLDLRMPDIDGITLLNQIRKNYADLPVILMTAYGSFNSAVDALHLGAADYLLKPINPTLLIERIQKTLYQVELGRKRAQIQEQIANLQDELQQVEKLIATSQLPGIENVTLRLQPSSPPDSVPGEASRFMFVGNLSIDLQARRANLSNSGGVSTPLTLPPATFDYLVVLARHAPETISYQDLVVQAQGYQAKPAEARDLAKWHIHHLRQALENTNGSSRQIINVRGIGYRLVID